MQINLPRQGIGIGLQQRRYIGIFLAGSAGLKNHSDMAGVCCRPHQGFQESTVEDGVRDLAWSDPAMKISCGQGIIIPQPLHGLENEHLRSTIKGVFFEYWL
jgi:hypothetical protein